MRDHIITEILKIEAEADTIVSDAKQKAGQIIDKIPAEIDFIRATIENEHHQKLEMLKLKITELQKSEEECLKNEFELRKKKLLQIDDKTMEDAVEWVVKYLYEG